MKKYFYLQKSLILGELLLLFLMPSCGLPDDSDDPEMNEMQQIQRFLSDNDTLDFQLKTSGLYYLDYITGTGPQVELHDTAYIFYSAHFIDLTILETNLYTEDTLIVPIEEGALLPGFIEAISYMKEGGTSLFVVPSKLAYGVKLHYYTSPYTSLGFYIYPYTPFVFQANLVKLVKHAD